MSQAYKNLNPGDDHYEFIKGQLKNLLDRWNSSHQKSQVDPDIIVQEFKSVIKYNHSIEVEDIRNAFDLGIMGKYGENYVLNSETIYRWFSGWLKQKISGRLKGATAHKGSIEPELSEDQKQAKRQQTRTALIEIFMKFYNDYAISGGIDPSIKKYYVVFWSWFRSLGLIDISEEDESRMNKAEAEHLRDLRSKLTTPELSQSKYKKFIEIFETLDALEIENQLKSIKL